MQWGVRKPNGGWCKVGEVDVWGILPLVEPTEVQRLRDLVKTYTMVPTSNSLHGNLYAKTVLVRRDQTTLPWVGETFSVGFYFFSSKTFFSGRYILGRRSFEIWRFLQSVYLKEDVLHGILTGTCCTSYFIVKHYIVINLLLCWFSTCHLKISPVIFLKNWAKMKCWGTVSLQDMRY